MTAPTQRPPVASDRAAASDERWFSDSAVRAALHIPRAEPAPPPAAADDGMRERLESAIYGALSGYEEDFERIADATRISTAWALAAENTRLLNDVADGRNHIGHLAQEVERLKREADGQFVEAAVRVMRANPGFVSRDYAEDGITADDFEMFFTEDMNEAWRQSEQSSTTIATLRAENEAKTAEIARLRETNRSLRDQNRDGQMLAFKWMERHDKVIGHLQSGQSLNSMPSFPYPSPADVPATESRATRAEAECERMKGERCAICSTPLNMSGRAWTNDCGGDCTACMADAGDPDAIATINSGLTS